MHFCFMFSILLVSLTHNVLLLFDAISPNQRTMSWYVSILSSYDSHIFLPNLIVCVRVYLATDCHLGIQWRI